MNKALSTITLLVVGAAIGAVGFSQFGATSTAGTVASAEKQPLYWVAPMDPNYRRDKPGQSPMGMDLIAVYDQPAGAKDSPGTIKISPDVVNNLGVRTSEVAYRRFNDQINTVGYIGYDEDRLIHIHPRVEGWLDKLYIKTKGAQVIKGEPLYDIYSPALVNAQEELMIALERNNKRLIGAAKARLSALLVPQSTIKQLISTRKVKQNITIFAPQSGVVDNLNVREGFFVKPGTKIMSIGALDDVWVNAEVFERQASFVAVGNPVVMTLDYLPGQRWQGKVDYIYPTLDANTRTVKVRLRFSNPNFELKPNMFAQVTIASDSGKALLVPKEAVIRTGESNRVVMALGEGKFKSVNVEIGRTNRQSIEVVHGLEVGDNIVVSAQFLLDSESSISSDFMRMNHDVEHVDQYIEPAVFADAIIESMMPEHRMITVTHQPIPAWGWPSMTMDFIVDKAVDMNKLTAGLSLNIEIIKNKDNQYVITNTHMAGQTSSMKDMDHSKMSSMKGMSKMQGMDPSNMSNMKDMSKMQDIDHSKMSGIKSKPMTTENGPATKTGAN